MKKKRPKTLRPVHANAGVEAEYRRKLTALVDAMHASVLRSLRAAYRREEPRVVPAALDESPAVALRKRLEKLMDGWTKRFETLAPKIARWLARRTETLTAASLNNALRAAGIAVRYKPTRRAAAMTQSVVEANVALIKSIPERYHAEVAELVQRSMQTGRDIAGLTDELEKKYRITRARARFIARDQNNKATATLRRAQDEELGITEGLWLHVPGRKSSRASHMKMNGTRFTLAEGCYDPDPRIKRKIQPGELPGCQCTYRPIIPGIAGYGEKKGA